MPRISKAEFHAKKTAEAWGCKSAAERLERILQDHDRLIKKGGLSSAELARRARLQKRIRREGGRSRLENKIEGLQARSRAAFQAAARAERGCPFASP